MIKKIRKYLRSLKDSSYNDKLINKLKKDHENLLELFISLEEAINQQKAKKSLKILERFLHELELHLLLENSKLYTHIEVKYRLCKLENIKKN